MNNIRLPFGRLVEIAGFVCVPCVAFFFLAAPIIAHAQTEAADSSPFVITIDGTSYELRRNPEAQRLIDRITQAAESNPVDPSPGPETKSGTTPTTGDASVADTIGSIDQTSRILLGVIALVLVGTAILFLIVLPNRRRKPLIQAIALLHEDDIEQFKDAEELLDIALTRGMGKKDVSDAKFALAYVRARMHRFADAAAVLSGPLRSSNVNRESVYLELWLRSQLEDHDNVEAIHIEHSELLGDLLDTRLIVGKCLLNRARKHWDHKEIQGAIHYSEQLRQLKVPELKEEIPAQIDDHQVVLGVQSLFQHNIADARKFFAGAVSSAEERKKSPLKGRLGLLLCQWKSEDLPEVDSELGDVLNRMLSQGDGKTIRFGICRCKKCGHQFRVKESYADEQLSCSECHGGFKVEITELEESPPPVPVKENKKQSARVVTDGDSLGSGIDAQPLCDYRSFTANSGKQLHGRILSVVGDEVTLQRKKSGKRFAFSFSDFSSADRDYIESLIEQSPLKKPQMAPGENSEDGADDESAEDFAADSSTELQGDTLLNEADLLLRNVCLWYATSLLVQWHRLPEREGLPEEQLDSFRERTRRVVEIDPEMGDAQLLEGLITYYLAANEAQRREGFGLIEESTKHDVNLPQILSLCDREKRMADLNERSRDRFYQVLEAYLHDNQVKPEHRDWLREKLRGFSRFEALGPNIVIDSRDAAPTTNDLRSRGALISSRVASVVKTHFSIDSENVESLNQLVEQLNSAGQNLEQEAKRLEKVEREVLASTGEFLFKEEVTVHSSE